MYLFILGMFELIKDTSIIITAAGEGIRWNNEISELKQLAIIEGKPVIQRTIDQLHNYGYNNVYVATRSDVLANAISNAQIIEPQKTNSLSDTILSCAEYFSDRTVIILGDVYLSDSALQNILDFKGEIQFFGLDRSSIPVIKENRSPEIFALCYTKKSEKKMRKLLDENSTFAQIRDYPFRQNRLYLWLRKKKLSENLKKAYGPIPPDYFVRKGYKPNPLWKLMRIVFHKPNYAKFYGKLWGLYIRVAEIDAFSGEGASWPVTSNNYFIEINDITDDIDDEADFFRLKKRILSIGILPLFQYSIPVLTFL